MICPTKINVPGNRSRILPRHYKLQLPHWFSFLKFLNFYASLVFDILIIPYLVPDLGFVNSHTISQREMAQGKMQPITEDAFFPEDIYKNEIKTASSSKSNHTSVSSPLPKRVSSELPQINEVNRALVTAQRKPTSGTRYPIPQFLNINHSFRIIFGYCRVSCRY